VEFEEWELDAFSNSVPKLRISFMDCIELRKLTVFPADAAKSSITTCSR
jgi:hypothetical protein